MLLGEIRIYDILLALSASWHMLWQENMEPEVAMGEHCSPLGLTRVSPPMVVTILIRSETLNKFFFLLPWQLS